MKLLLKALFVTSIAGLIGGRIFAAQIYDMAQTTTDFGAWLVFIVAVIAIYQAAKSCSAGTFKKLWIGCAICWPLFITMGYYGSLSLAKNAMMSQTDNSQVQAQVVDNFREEYGRDPSPEELDELKTQVSDLLDQGLTNGGFGNRESTAVKEQWLIGPLCVSCICCFILILRKRRESQIIASQIRANGSQYDVAQKAVPNTFQCNRCSQLVYHGMRFCSKCGSDTSLPDRVVEKH